MIFQPVCGWGGEPRLMGEGRLKHTNLLRQKSYSQAIFYNLLNMNRVFFINI